MIPCWVSIVKANSREEAIQLMIKALEELKIEGVPNTTELHKYLLKSEPFNSGQYSTPDMSKVVINSKPKHT